MDIDFIIDLLLLGPIGVLTLFITLRIFFKSSILYKIGLVVGIFALFLTSITVFGDRIALYAEIVTTPLAIGALIYAFRYLGRAVKKPLVDIRDVVLLLKDGNIDDVNKLNITTKDEFGEISDSANKLIEGFSAMSDFAHEIGKGNLDVDFEVLSENDSLGHSLLEMQKSLIQAREEDEKRKREDEKLFWANEGYARFGEILRQNTESNTEFYYTIISNLVKYVGANQGGLFLINDDNQDDRHIELVSMYAYERRKYVNRRIELGESLVGQCVLEGESIYMTEIPQNYIRVTSGLGDANPTSLLLVPLIFNEEVYGVLELAAFSEFEPYKKQFIEKLGESIASTISTYKINLRTVKLLEDSKTQSEELAAQEEEIRQNMEELQTTQEESARREAEMNNALAAIKTGNMVAELDLQGKVIEMNPAYQRFLGTNNSSGTYWGSFFSEADNESLAELMQEVVEGNAKHRVSTVPSGKSMCESFTLVMDADGYPVKILNIGLEIL